MKTSQKILDYISKNNQASGNELAEHLAISSRAVRKQLRNLLNSGHLRKIGKPPKVYYLINSISDITNNEVNVDDLTRSIIDQQYLYVDPSGKMTPGIKGFVVWCKKTNQDVSKTAQEYTKTLKKFDRYKKDGLIDGMDKLKSTFDQVFLDKLYYLDFYSIERFGKTKIGQLLLHAKSGQDKVLIKKLSMMIEPKIKSLIRKYQVDAVLFIPPTVKREVQFMHQLEKNLTLTLKSLAVTKVKTEVILPQKTLSKLKDRIENASNTIIVDDTGKYNNILLIDDAVGSGATLNQTAAQIKSKNIIQGKLIGLAVSGSFKGFDVISEV
jgi:biotin operon repressor